MSDPLCVVCAERPRSGIYMCRVCGIAYTRQAHDVGSIGEVLEWSANRARWFERRRQRRQRSREMITIIKGEPMPIEHARGGVVVMTAGGVGYHIVMTDYDRVVVAGRESVQVYVTPVYREDDQRLFGFLQSYDRAVFDRMRKGKVGVSVAMAALSHVGGGHQLVATAKAGNVDAIKGAHGVGVLTAGTIIKALS